MLLINKLIHLAPSNESSYATCTSSKWTFIEYLNKQTDYRSPASFFIVEKCEVMDNLYDVEQSDAVTPPQSRVATFMHKLYDFAQMSTTPSSTVPIHTRPCMWIYRQQITVQHMTQSLNNSTEGLKVLRLFMQ